LHGSLTEDTYMEIPEGYTKHPEKICKLQKALYGLKQAPLNWNQRLTDKLKTRGLKPTKVEPCIYVNESHSIILAFYVDDGIIIGSDRQEVKQLISSIGNKFEIATYTNPTSFLGIQLIWNKRSVKLKQMAYAKSIIIKYRMEDAKISGILMMPNDTRLENGMSKFPYRECVGSILYLANKTRPDLSYASGYVSRYLDKQSKQDIVNVKQILRYIKGTLDLGIVFENTNTRLCENCEKLVCYVDSDYAGDTETRRSTTGFVIYYSNGPISWSSKKQPIVALSSTEAEFIAAAHCVKELMYLQTLLEELTGNTVRAVINIDNQSTLQIIKNGTGNKRSKHIDVRYHYLNEKYVEGMIELKYCPTDEQIADVFTKPLSRVKFEKFRNKIVKL